ncbi:TetR/AcrR family transcriptional regulator [Nonomuraea sp. NN258]|uniref:TetR/AcrR family transcriptional regulator C-terminal domain-containing protein n=1 Tax=Nonomuraea antri TaxID=2730852 RepID=UPI0015688FAF|nr:TetR/AcrR family transcriptional regulator C-terminal domain-containing protein [Nonomuraea antri]NRQ39484.1 TetR/AcrR family transcriptional regulator [Nonomuraea antri]
MKTGGRTAGFVLRDVIRAGTRIGLAELTVQGVADALGVTTAAIYRHVPSRSRLESLVGEAILEDLTLVDDPAEPAVAHLVGFAAQLRRFTLAHPGTAEYLQRLFPRGASGVRLLEHQINALCRRGYDPAAATVLSSAIATITLGVTIAEQERAAHLEPQAAEEAMAAMTGSPLLRQALAGIPPHTPEDYFVTLLTATAEGLVATFPPGAPLVVPRTAH